jgi:hypothetical protein
VVALIWLSITVSLPVASAWPSAPSAITSTSPYFSRARTSESEDEGNAKLRRADYQMINCGLETPM